MRCLFRKKKLTHTFTPPSPSQSHSYRLRDVCVCARALGKSHWYTKSDWWAKFNATNSIKTWIYVYMCVLNANVVGLSCDCGCSAIASKFTIWHRVHDETRVIHPNLQSQTHFVTWRFGAYTPTREHQLSHIIVEQSHSCCCTCYKHIISSFFFRRFSGYIDALWLSCISSIE